MEMVHLHAKRRFETLIERSDVFKIIVVDDVSYHADRFTLMGTAETVEIHPMIGIPGTDSHWVTATVLRSVQTSSTWQIMK